MGRRGQLPRRRIRADMKRRRCVSLGSSAVYVLAGCALVWSDDLPVNVPQNSADVVGGRSEIFGNGRILLVQPAAGALVSAPCSTIIRAAPANHYSWGQDCDGWKLIDLPGLSLREERMGARSKRIPHVHREATQLFFMLEGSCTMATSRETRSIEVMRGLLSSLGRLIRCATSERAMHASLRSARRRQSMIGSRPARGRVGGHNSRARLRARATLAARRSRGLTRSCISARTLRRAQLQPGMTRSTPICYRPRKMERADLQPGVEVQPMRIRPGRPYP